MDLGTDVGKQEGGDPADEQAEVVSMKAAAQENSRAQEKTQG